MPPLLIAWMFVCHLVLLPSTLSPQLNKFYRTCSTFHVNSLGLVLTVGYRNWINFFVDSYLIYFDVQNEVHPT